MAHLYLKVFIVMSTAGVLWNSAFHMQQRGEQVLSLEAGYGGRGFPT